MEIELDLTQKATRSELLDQLIGLMSSEQRSAYERIVAQARIPDKHHHSIVEVNDSIDALAIDGALKMQLRDVYAILARAEASVHGCAVDQAHFHEVGNASGIRNALAICAAFYVLAPTRITATPVQTGRGTVECAHGLMDVPAPATAAILEGIPRAKPVFEGELCTPTSAAIIRHYVQEFVV